MRGPKSKIKLAINGAQADLALTLARLMGYARMTALMSLVFALTAVNIAPAAAPKIVGSNDVRTRQHEAVKLARAGEIDEALQIIASLRLYN